MTRVAVLKPGSDDSFPSVERALREPDGLLAIGGDLSPRRILDAYRHGIFPWYSEGEPILWWSPDPRMVFCTGSLHISTRMRRWIRHCPWTIRADTAFERVMRSCAQPRPGQRGTWITDEMISAYSQLHALGHAHCVEVHDDDALVGGIYGIAIGRMFFGESMFSREANASKLALVALCKGIGAWGMPLVDAQVVSAHLKTLGAREMPRARFVSETGKLCALPAPVDGSWQHDWDVRRPSDCL